MKNLFHKSRIYDVSFISLQKIVDQRGWLCELFRSDETDFNPAMFYMSMTHKGESRGPHEHKEQSDYFCFIGPSNFKIWLWDNRHYSATYRAKQIEIVGEDNPMAIIIPPGIVHAYQNIGNTAGIVLNCPNQLYKGMKKSGSIDEIRHEDDSSTIFQLE